MTTIGRGGPPRKEMSAEEPTHPNQWVIHQNQSNSRQGFCGGEETHSPGLDKLFVAKHH